MGILMVVGGDVNINGIGIAHTYDRKKTSKV